MPTRLASALALVAAVSLLTPFAVPRYAGASHATFDFAIDRVDIDGNTFGPFDGTPDFVDDFDDGNIAPWANQYGSIVETGGVMHLRAPGAHFLSIGELSSADLQGFSQGAGSLAAAVRVLRTIPGVNQGFTFAVSDGAATEFFQIAIGQDSVSQSYGQYFVVSAGQTHPIKPSDITGDIVLQIVFDDALDQISSAFSLDGGITFQAFSNAYTFNVIPSGMFVLLGGQNLCGDGVIDPGEACDDANVNSGDGCDMGCQVEACFSCAGSPSVCPPIVACSDEEDGCCPAGCEPDTDSDCLCAGLPRTSCRRPTESGNSVLLVRVPGGTSGTLVWKWVKRAETNAGDFGEPLTETEYRLCAYHRFGLAGGPRLAVNATAAAGGTCGGKPCWRPIGSTGFKYKDKERRSDGLNTLLLKAGTAGKARLLAKGKGPNLQIRQLPLITPVTVQLQATNGVCWEAVYTTPLKSDETQFKARAD